MLLRLHSWFVIFLCLCHALLRSSEACAQSVPSQDVSVSVMDKKSADLAPGFLGLSTRSSHLLSTNGHYYFDAKDQALVNTFKTLGIKNLRLGGNAVDCPHVAIPSALATNPIATSRNTPSTTLHGSPTMTRF